MAPNHNLSNLYIAGVWEWSIPPINPRESPIRNVDELAASSGSLHAFAGAVISTGGTTVLCDSFTVRAATGFSQNKAKNAAIRSQAIIAQKTLVHEPVFSNNHAAPKPAKSAPIPLAV